MRKIRKKSHSNDIMILPDPQDVLLEWEESRAWKKRFVQNQIDGTPMVDPEILDYSEATYDCLCSINYELRRIADALCGGGTV